MEKLINLGKKSFKFVIIFLIFLIVISNSTVKTNPKQYSIIKQFGKIVRIEKTEDTTFGLSFKIPFLQSVTKIGRYIILYDLAPSEVMTSDKKTMIADCFTMWEISDPKLFIQKLSGSRETAEYRVNTTVYNSMKNAISSITQEEVITGRDGQLSKMILEGIGDNLEGYGINVVAIETKMLDLPTENKQSVYNRMISERNNIAATFIAKGQQEATEIKNSTNEKVTMILSEANQESDRIIAEGDAAYMKLMSAAYNNESKAEFYTFVRQLDAMKISFENSNGIIVLDKNSPITELFYGLK